MEKNIPDEEYKLVKKAALSFHAGLYGYEDMGFIDGAKFYHSLASKALSDANKEIERLKGLIEKAFKSDGYYEKFKTENNL